MSKMDFSQLIEQHVDLADESEKSKEENGQEEKSVEKEEISAGPSSFQKKDQVNEEEKKKEGKLMKAETQKVGKIGSETFMQYIQNGGTVIAITVLILHILSQGAYITSFWWLTYLIFLFYFTLLYILFLILQILDIAPK